MALTVADIQKAYIAFFNRPADVPGLNYWLGYTGDEQDLLTEFSLQAEYLSDYAGLTNLQMLNKVYNNLFGRNPEPSGQTYWLAQMDAGYVTIANVAFAVLGGAQNEDLDTINNKVEVATAFTTALDTPAEIDAYNKAGTNGVADLAKNLLKTVDYSDASKAAALADVDHTADLLVQANVVTPPPTGGDTIWLGGNPTIFGTEGNDTFKAQTGQLTDNVVLDGRGGDDTLEATIRGNEAIAPEVRNIEKVIIRGQDSVVKTDTDNNVWDLATVDADRFTGVNWWESKQSRVDVKVENVNILDNQITKDITIAFRESDPGHVDFAVYFDQPYLRNQTTTSGILRAALYDSMGAATGQPLLDNPYSKILFDVDGTPYEVNFGTVNGNKTFQDLRDAIQDAILADPALAPYNISVTLVEGVSYVVPSETAIARADAGYYLQIQSVGHTITDRGWATADGYVPSLVSTQGRQDSSNPTSSDLVTSTIILDYVGKGSMGGDLVIGGQSVGYTSTSKGVQQFDISVERDSKLEVISSTNNTLQVVNLVNKGTNVYLGAYERANNQGARPGDLTVMGDTNVATIFGKTIPQLADPTWTATANNAQQSVDGAGPQQFNGYGFTDVRVVNGAGFQGNLTLNAILTENVVGKYMNLADKADAVASADNVNFIYALGSGDDSLNLAISARNLQAAGTTTREDFVLNVNGNAGNDNISTAIYSMYSQNALANAYESNWYANHQQNANLAINAGTGNDTVRTLGSGDWKVTLGTGSDTYYADNTDEKAVWVFNTTDQNTAAPTTVARTTTNLLSDANNNYISVGDGYSVSGSAAGYQSGEMSGLYGLKLRVVFNDVSASANNLPDAQGQGTYISSVVQVPTASSNRYAVSDLNINQAIKKAINDDPVLSKLLSATDGPSNTLVVTALSDGRHIDVNDLQIEFAIPVDLGSASITEWNGAIKGINWTAAELVTGRNAAFYQLLNKAAGVAAVAEGVGNSTLNDYGTNAGAGYTGWWTSNTLANGDYKAAFGNDGAAHFTGEYSGHVSNNVIIVDSGASDHDVVVLSTGSGSSDTIKWDGTTGNGLVTVVNFDTQVATPGAAARYTLDLTTTNWATSDGTTEVTIDIPGVGTQTITMGIAAVTPVTAAAQIAALLTSANFSGLTIANAGSTVTFTHPTAGITMPSANPTITDTGGGTPVDDLSTAGGAFTQATGTGLLGDDWLDFTAYGALWLGAATLDSTGKVSGTNGWDVAQDVRGAHTSTATVYNTTLPGPDPNRLIEDYTVKTGDKYITLTREFQDNGTPVNPDRTTVYKIELWTVVGNEADAYRDLTAGETRDTVQLIGYIDLGKEIDLATTSTNDILSHIDYIA